MRRGGPMRPQEGECGQADLLRTSSTVIRDADKAMKITNVGPSELTRFVLNVQPVKPG
jgi:hypothetical protein